MALGQAVREASSVCVTGASGFVASHIIKVLLAKGYHVNGTVRDARNMEKYGWLQELAAGTPGKLTLFSADLLAPGSFDEAVGKSDSVFHVAAVLKMDWKDPQKEIVDPAVEGTRNVFNAILKSKRAQRVVLTSTYLSMADPWAPPHTVFSEKDWHKEMSLKNPYMLGKTLAEQHAWRVYEEQKERAKRGGDGGWSFELVSINPGLVLGDLLHKSQAGATPRIIREMAAGEMPALPRFSWPVVHVRDAAEGHVRALELPNANGRNILAEDRKTTSMRDMAKWIKEKYPKSAAPQLEMPDALSLVASIFIPNLSFAFTRRTLAGRTHLLTSEKASTELGVSFRDPKDAVIDSLDSYINKGLLPALA